MASTKDATTIHFRILELLMRPMVRFCLRNSHSFQDFLRVGKLVFIRCAEEEMSKAGGKVNISRISVVTGIRRDEVKRIFHENEEPAGHVEKITSRVVLQWWQDQRFCTKAGKPRILSHKGDENEFSELVQAVSKHIHPGTVLFDLKRLGAVEETPRGLKLISRAYTYEKDVEGGFELLSRDMESLLCGVEENMMSRQPVSNLHLRTEFDNIDPKELRKIRQWLIKEGKTFHQKVHKYLSKYDRDITPKDGSEGGAEVVVGSFGMTTPFSKR